MRMAPPTSRVNNQFWKEGGEEMKSLHERLDPQKEEVLRVTETFGRFKAMRQFRVLTYDRFHNWLKEVTGDENFGLRPKISLDGRQTLGEQLVYAFIRKVAQLEAENERLRQRVEILELQLSPAEETEDLQTMAVLDVCQV